MIASEAEVEGGYDAEVQAEEKHHWSLDQNAKMHPRNKYWNNPPDFKRLAKLYPRFGQHLQLSSEKAGSLPHINWRDSNACISVTQTLLLHDFKLDWDLPAGFLCPPVPQRANYIHWIEDLLAGPIECAVSEPRSIRIPQNVSGMDIGAGASCIYPLLGVRLNPTWNFIASDINDEAIASAQRNIDRNGLGI